MTETRRKLRRPIGALLLLIAGILLSNRTRVLADAAYVSLLPVLLCAGKLLLSSGRRGTARQGVQWGAVWWSAALTLLFLAACSVFELRNTGFFRASYLAEVYADSPFLSRFYLLFHRFVYLPAVALSAFGLLYGALTACADGRLRCGDRGAAGRASVLRCGLAFAVAAAFGVMCVYPMYPVSDTLFIKELIERGEWDTWHTMGYLLFVRITSLGGANYFLPVIAQGIIWVLTNLTALRFLSKRNNGRRACILYTAVMLAAFLPAFYCGVMYKDGLFMSCMLGLTVSLFETLTDERLTRGNLWRLTAFGLGTALFRLGTLPVVLIALVAVWIFYLVRRLTQDRKRAAAAFAVTVCAALFVGQILPYGVLGAKKPAGYVKYTVPLGMIGAVASSGVPIDVEERAVMEQIMPVDAWAEAYDPYFMDPLSRTDAAIGKNVEKIDTLGLGPKLLWLNWRFLTRYPQIYLTAFFNANSIVWEWGRPDDARAYEWTWLVDQAADPTQSGVDGMTTRTFGFTALTVGAARATHQIVWYRSLVWRGGASLFMLLLCAAALSVKRLKKLWIALIPILCYTATLMLSIPSQDPRYILPALVTAVFFIVSTFACVDGRHCAAATDATDKRCEALNQTEGELPECP